MKKFYVLIVMFTVLSFMGSTVNAQAKTKIDVKKEYRNLISDIENAQNVKLAEKEILEIFDRAEALSDDIVNVYGCNKKSREMVLALARECAKLV